MPLRDNIVVRYVEKKNLDIEFCITDRKNYDQFIFHIDVTAMGVSPTWKEGSGAIHNLWNNKAGPRNDVIHFKGKGEPMQIGRATPFFVGVID